MIDMLDRNLTFKELVIKFEAIKDQYKGTLSLFSCGFDIKEKVKYIEKTRNQVYSLRPNARDKWQCDKLWRYMNDDMTYNDLLDRANRQKVK